MSTAPSHILEQLLETPQPTDLASWCYQTIVASFPPVETAMTWGAVLHYLGWLDELEVLHGQPTLSQ